MLLMKLGTSGAEQAEDFKIMNIMLNMPNLRGLWDL